MPEQATATDIAVLREMVRLAENARSETVQSLERLNQYNLGIIAFNAGFMSFLVSNSFPMTTIRVAGIFLLISMFTSLFALSPKKIRGAVLRVDTDVRALKQGEQIDLYEFLLATAELTDRAFVILQERAKEKKFLTIFSSTFLVLALVFTYTLYAYA